MEEIDVRGELMHALISQRKLIEGAIVVLDAACAACLHWAVLPPIHTLKEREGGEREEREEREGREREKEPNTTTTPGSKRITGIGCLFALGACFVDVMDEKEPEQEDNTAKTPHHPLLSLFNSSRVVFLISGYLPKYKGRLRRTLLKRQYTHCTVLCGLPAEQHTEFSSIGSDVFSAYIEMLKGWMQTERTSSTSYKPDAQILHFPLLYYSLGANTVLLPECADAFPLPGGYITKQDLPLDQWGSSRMKLTDIPYKHQVPLRRLCRVLEQVLMFWECRVDIYPMGHTSRLLAHHLTQQDTLIPDKDNPTLYRNASLLLIDRTLDLVEPMRHSDNIADRILECLPEYKNTSDVLVPITHLHPHITPPPIHGDSIGEGGRSSTGSTGEGGVHKESIVNEGGEEEIKSRGADMKEEEEEEEKVEEGKEDSADEEEEEGFIGGDLCMLGSTLDRGEDVEATGSLSGALMDEDNATPLLEAFLTQSSKSVMEHARRTLLSIIQEENLTKPSRIKKAMMGKVTVKLLSSLLRYLCRSVEVFYRHRGVIQVVQAALHALLLSKDTQWDQLLGSEKVMTHIAKDPNQQSLLSLVASLGRGEGRRDRRLGVLHLLRLAVMSFSLHAPLRFYDHDISHLMDTLSNNLLTLPQSISWLREEEVSATLTRYYELLPSRPSEGKDERERKEGEKREDEVDSNEFLRMQMRMELGDVVESWKVALQQLSYYRAHLHDYRDVVSGTSPSMYKPLMRRMMEDLFGSPSSSLNDIKRMSPHSKGFLSSFGWGGAAVEGTHSRPTDHHIIIVFVVGGITCSEIQAVRETLQKLCPKDKRHQVIIGGSSIASPSSILRALLK